MTEPIATGELEANLARALQRSDRPALEPDWRAEVLSGGRTGLSVQRIRSGARSYVLKLLPSGGWRTEAMEGAPGSEATLWWAGATRELPAPLSCSVIDVAIGPQGHRWMLMDDVSRGICARGAFGHEHEVQLFEGIAALHARYWDAPELTSLPLATMAGTTRVWGHPARALAAGPEAVAASPSWVRVFLADFRPMAALLPAFLELLEPTDRDLYRSLLEDESWWTVLDEGPATLVHGDLRRANIAFLDDRISLIDWEFAARGPAATDLVWHAFLHFWAYPPDERGADAHEPLFERYLARLESLLGRRVDRDAFARSRDAAWLRIIVQLGYCLADPALGADVDAETVATVRGRCAAALRAARDALERLRP